MQNLVVCKFGGTSLANPDCLERAAAAILSERNHGGRVVVVVSAMGKQTNELLALATDLHPAPPKRELDMLLSAGERISMALLSITLHRLGVPSMSLTGSQSGILTSGPHGNAQIRSVGGERIRAGLEENKVVIVAGFQGVDPDTKEITTLGRGGSDLTAIALAASLKAHRCDIYTDVPGVMTADPRIVPGAHLIPKLSWAAMQALSASGSNVLHHRAATMARRFQVPLRILSSFTHASTHDKVGTAVSQIEAHPMEKAKVLNISQRKALTRVRAQSTQVTLTAALEWVQQQGETPALTQLIAREGETASWELMLPDHLTSSLQTELGLEKLEERVDNLALVTIHGMGFKRDLLLLDKILKIATPRATIVNIDDDRISLTISTCKCDAIVKDLHGHLFE